MAFRLSDEQRAIREAVREFGEEEITPVAREHDEEKKYPEDLVRKAAELDLVAPSIPVEYGGAGMDTLSSIIVTEELWRADAGIGSAIGSRGFGSNMIRKFGDEWMKEEWLPRIADGESACCSCISEPGHGSNVAGIETVAEREGDEYVIDGNKMWITNGTVADVAVVMAKTDPEAEPPHRGHQRHPRSHRHGRVRTDEDRQQTRHPSLRPRGSSSTTCASPRRTSSARRTRGSTS